MGGSDAGAGPEVPDAATQLRACVLAERLIQCERFLAGGSSRVFANKGDAIERMARVGFREADRRGIERLMFNLADGALSEMRVRGYRTTLKEKLAKIIGCEPMEITATPDGVRQHAKA